MPQCKNCDGFVSGEFVRVFGTNDGHVYGCPDCKASPELQDGGAATPP